MLSLQRVSPVATAVAIGGLGLAPVAAQDTPTFTSDVALVVVDAVVLDDDGQPVAGLGPGDFELRDEGEPREVLSFEALDAATVPVASSREARRVATNVTAGAGRVMAVFWDDVHLTPPFAERAKKALRPWLTERLALGDRIVLASAGGAWHVVEDAREQESLLGLLDALKGEKALPSGDPEYVSDYEATAISQMNDSITYGVVYRRFAARGVMGCGSARLAPGELVRRRTSREGDLCPVMLRAREVELAGRARLETTLGALGHLADVLAVGRGRKSIVLVSEGFLQHPDASPEFAAVARAAQQANAVVSFLDPAGLRADPAFGAVDSGAPVLEDQAQAHAIAQAEPAGSESLAHNTGGLILHPNDLAAGLDRITRESDTHYLLGFAPPPGAEAGSFRRLALTVHRSGLKVRARTGYTVGGGPPREPDQELRLAVDAPFHLSGLPLRVAAWVLDPRPPGLSRVLLGVDVAAPSGMGNQGSVARKLELYAEIQGGERRWRQGRELVFDPRASSGEDERQLVLLGLDLPAGTFRARAVVRGPSGRVLGAVTHVFDVPEADAWHLSTPLLSPSLEVEADGGIAAPQPTTRRDFEVGANLYGQFAVYATPGEADSVAGRLSGSWSLRRTGSIGPDRSGSLPLAALGKGQVACGFSLPLSGLAPGEYELTLRVRDDLEGRELESAEIVTLAGTAGTAGPTAAGEAAPEADDAVVRDAEPVDSELASLLERAGRYVLEYEESFSNLIAEEDYTQWVATKRRNTRAELVFIRLPGDAQWGTFRDVFEVDGQEVRDRDGRLERLFLEAPSSSIEQARDILRASSAYNIGPRRTMNMPTLGLLFLHPGHQYRSVFERKGERRIAGVLGVEVRFQEVASPTLVETGAGDLPAKGRVWIDPHRGTVLRTEASFLFRPEYSTATITTEFRPEPALAMWVPSEMREEYRDNPGRGMLLFGKATDAAARYSNFRRFGVVIEEKARLADPDE